MKSKIFSVWHWRLLQLYYYLLSDAYISEYNKISCFSSISVWVIFHGFFPIWYSFLWHALIEIDMVTSHYHHGGAVSSREVFWIRKEWLRWHIVVKIFPWEFFHAFHANFHPLCRVSSKTMSSHLIRVLLCHTCHFTFITMHSKGGNILTFLFA